MYAVIDKDGRTKYLGDDSGEAIRTFENLPGSRLEKPVTIEDFAALLKGAVAEPQHKLSDEDAFLKEVAELDDNDFDNLDDSLFDEEIEELLKMVKKQFGNVSEAFWSNLATIGVTKEKAAAVWAEFQEEASKVAAEAEVGGRQGLAALGDILVQVGNALANRAKK